MILFIHRHALPFLVLFLTMLEIKILTLNSKKKDFLKSMKNYFPIVTVEARRSRALWPRCIDSYSNKYSTSIPHVNVYDPIKERKKKYSERTWEVHKKGNKSEEGKA